MIRPLLFLPISLLPLAAGTVEFNRDIRPILTSKCTACHGGVKEAGEVSFIYRDKALAAGESGNRTIVPGHPEQSEMIRRLRTDDPEDVMPKPKEGPPLPENQIKLIERWIAEGAEWQEHWSFVPPAETPTGEISDPSWPSSPLDRFVLARLDHEKLKSSPEAAPAEWLRRVSFDLTGLPPTPDELAAFETALKSDPAAARAAVADRLLASPAFGERWAAVWMDLARYSDTYGFEKDPGRDIWPYRDWLIRAFNADMPYDEFIVEQLAGDLLPNATADQRLATAFHRNTQTNTEGGTDDEEFRVAAVIDRVNTTWTTFQATTFGCVQCHSHPYDPIQHDDYYRFLAFFNGTEDCDQDDDFPKMKIAADPAQADRASKLEIEIRGLREKLNSDGAALAASAVWQPFSPDEFAPQHGTLSLAADGTIVSSGTLPVGTTHKVAGPAKPFTALRLQILPDSTDPKKWPERGSLASTFDVTLIAPDGTRAAVPMKEVFADHLGGYLEPTPQGNVGEFPKLNGPRWFVFVPETPVAPGAGARMEIAMKQNGSTTGAQGTPVRHFALARSEDPAWTALANDPARLETWKSRAAAAAEYNAIQGTMVPVMVAGPPRETRVFERGNRITKGEIVTPGVPKILAGGAPPEGMDRLAMARWIASPANPLTARVMANRLWGELFGIGIVETMEDFGTSGARPSQPALLDHLALRFENDFHWSVKSLLREIVLSATYRQTNRASADLVRDDPQNRLLARGPRVRLTAEMLRDQALAVAGTLSPKMFGPPVFPPQPAGVWSSVYNGASWNESKGEDRVRRGIYTYNKRTSGYPGFLTFDAPSRDLCSARRISSNTPLQALVTLNDPVFMEAAQGMAKRMTAASPDLDSQLAFGVLLATQRTAAPATLAELASLHADLAAELEKSPAESAKLAETPSAAALALVASTILNLDSALNR